MADINQQAQEYYYLVQKGMAPAEAFKKVFPNGIPTAQERAKSAAGDQQKQAYGQLAGALAGLYGAKKLAEIELPSFGDLFSGGSSAGQSVATEATKEAASSIPDIISGSGVTGSESFPVQTMSDGSTLMSDGSTLAADGGGVMGTVGPVLGAVAAAKGGYDAINGMQHGGEGTRSGLTTMGAGIGSILLPGVGTVAGAAMGNAAGYGLQGNGIKNDLALAALGPPGWGLLAAKKLGLTNHKTTRQVAQENTGRLQKSWGDDEQSQNYLAAMRDQYNSAPPDPSKPFAGKYGSWDEYVKGGLEANDLTGVLGNLETYGPEYGKMNFEQQKALTQSNIDAGNYYSDKGEVKIRDMGKALSFLNPAQSGIKNLPITKGPAMIDPAKLNIPAGQVSPLAQALSRSKTTSPGIDKNGKRIAY